MLIIWPLPELLAIFNQVNISFLLGKPPPTEQKKWDMNPEQSPKTSQLVKKIIQNPLMPYLKRYTTDCCFSA